MRDITKFDAYSFPRGIWHGAPTICLRASCAAALGGGIHDAICSIEQCYPSYNVVRLRVRPAVTTSCWAMQCRIRTTAGGARGGFSRCVSLLAGESRRSGPLSGCVADQALDLRDDRFVVRRIQARARGAAVNQSLVGSGAGSATSIKTGDSCSFESAVAPPKLYASCRRRWRIGGRCPLGSSSGRRPENLLWSLYNKSISFQVLSGGAMWGQEKFEKSRFVCHPEPSHNPSFSPIGTRM